MTAEYDETMNRIEEMMEDAEGKDGSTGEDSGLGGLGDLGGFEVYWDKWEPICQCLIHSHRMTYLFCQMQI